MDDESPLTATELNEAENRSLREDLRQLAADARALADAEFAYQKSRAAFAGREARNLAILGAVAAAFVFFALMALVLGAVIALGPALTPWGATAAVAGALLLVAAVCAIAAKVRVARMKAVLLGEESAR